MLQKPVTQSYSTLFRVLAGTALVFSIIAAAITLTLLETITTAYNEASPDNDAILQEAGPEAFPLSVFPSEKTITEIDDLLPYIDKDLADSTTKPIRTSWFQHLGRKLASVGWYQNFASPSTRILVIWPGDRKEQVVDHFGDILRWDAAERTRFETLVIERTTFEEGAFLPGRYVLSVGATPEVAANAVVQRFNETVRTRYTDEIANEISLQDALTLASLIEREAYSFSDMREISGVLWNRLFTDMPLQLDASLQYIKANDPAVASWWPPVRPDDKFIDSPLNTYMYQGIPPAAIANPSPVTLLAVLNPRETDCYFYFHDEKGELYCSEDYEEHVSKLKRVYGQGR